MQIPYFIIGLVVLSVAVLIYRTPLPNIVEEDEILPSGQKHTSSRRINILIAGIIAQFFYVGAQAGVLGFFIRNTLAAKSIKTLFSRQVFPN